MSSRPNGINDVENLVILAALGGLGGLGTYKLIKELGYKRYINVLMALNLGALNAYVLNVNSKEPITDEIGRLKNIYRGTSFGRNRRSRRKNRRSRRN